MSARGGVSLVNLLFGCKGRISRTQYWQGCTGAGAGGAVLLFASALMLAPTEEKAGAGILGAIVFAILMVLLSWCGFALQVKRFHDRGRSGYWAMAPAVPLTMIVSAVLSGVATDAPAQVVVPQILPWLGILMLINLWLFVDLGLLSGPPGPNKYDHTPGAGGGALPIMPSGASAGGAPAPAGSDFSNAELAIERAIAAHARAAAASAAAHAPRPAGGGSFGRRAAR
jgi:uncharacterized membrane protein YhaH (DUF805 family)